MTGGGSRPTYGMAQRRLDNSPTNLPGYLARRVKIKDVRQSGSDPPRLRPERTDT